MDREWMLRHLTRAEMHVVNARQHVARQRQLVAELEGRGQDATQAKSLLATFEMSLRAHEDHLKTMQRDLAEAGSKRQSSG